MAHLVMHSYIAIKPHIGTTVLVGDPKPHKATENVHVNSKKCIYWRKTMRVQCSLSTGPVHVSAVLVDCFSNIGLVYLMISDSMFDEYSIFD